MVIDKIAEIKSRISIMDLVSKLGIDVGKGNFISSIFKEDKHPSLKLYPKSSTYYDYSTAAGGDVIDFYQNFYKLDKIKAIDDLYAIISGYTPIQKRPVLKSINDSKDFLESMNPTERYQYDERIGMGASENTVKHKIITDRLNKNREVFNEFFLICSKSSNQRALSYLSGKRKFSPETINKFKLFTIDNYYGCNNHLKKRFSMEQLQVSGLFNRKEDGSGNLVFYAHRIIIPYLWKGEISYLRGRYFDQDGESNTDKYKYLGIRNDGFNLNTPKRFYNVDRIINGQRGDKLYVTEGEFDAMAIEQMGFNAVAIPGVGNLPRIDKLVHLLKFNVVLCVDNDEPGQKLKAALMAFFTNNKKEVLVKDLGQKDANQLLCEVA